MAFIRDLGFDHVRLPMNCEPIIAAATLLGLPADYLARLRSRIGELLDHGLSVIIDIHPEESAAVCANTLWPDGTGTSRVYSTRHGLDGAPPAAAALQRIWRV